MAALGVVLIGVLGLFHPTELVLTPRADVRVLAGNESFLVHRGQAVGLRLAGNRVDGLLHGRTLSGYVLRVESAEFTLAVPGKIERMYRGALEVRPGQGMLEAVVAIDRERAVASTVAAELKPGTPLEALKAQAVATRSYYAASPKRHEHFDYCDTTHCQFLRAEPLAGSPPAIPTSETAGIIVTYKGRPLPVVFSGSCGGRTATGATAASPAG